MSNLYLVPPSSLIFLVVIAIWAAYLLQHWLRRREHLATARSVDRFSEAMRVLDRGQAAPTSIRREETTRAYAASPIAPARPQVLVKRASAPTAPVLSTPGVGSASSRLSRNFASYSTSARARAEELGSGRAVRTVLFVAALVFTVASVGLGLLDVVGAKTISVSVIALLATFVYLRRAVAAELATRSAARRGVGAPRGAVKNRRSASSQSPSLRAAETAPEQFAAAVDRDEVFDVSAALYEPAPEKAHRVRPPALDGTWEPVPVPRPTYTMKAMAVQARPTPVEVTEVVEEVDDVVDPYAVSYLSRRALG